MSNTVKDMEDLDLAMNNGYHILMGDVTIDDLITKKNRGEVYLSFNPEDLQTDIGWETAINNMINYFIETEEYEKCAQLKSIL
tara:strand:+ start:110 stop:358 length:249 start_codon:yes stop_codon:yes gene_type:complete